MIKLWIKCISIPSHNVLYLCRRYPRTIPKGKIQTKDSNEKWINANIKAVAKIVILGVVTICN